jgi:hypothetical protein
LLHYVLGFAFHGVSPKFITKITSFKS